MTTEQIDLALVKSLINHVWELKKQVQTLTQKLDKTEKERIELADKVSYKDSYFNEEMTKLKQLHQNTIDNMEKANREQVDTLVSTHKKEKQTLVNDYEKQLKDTVSELKKENESISDTLEKLAIENQAIINRIRGIE
ncbi:MAG: hypothetical protein KGV56_04030 [Gammaproteobacteria bacterium]|nr:hypothetical protein [Gammaproteobacteria bacterium]